MVSKIVKAPVLTTLCLVAEVNNQDNFRAKIGAMESNPTECQALHCMESYLVREMS